MDETFDLFTVSQAIALPSKNVVRLLQVIRRGTICSPVVILLVFLEQAALERACRVEVDALGHETLLVLEHFLARVPYQAQLVHIDLDFVLVVFEPAQNRQSVPNAHIVRGEPHADLRLAFAGLASMVPVVVQPEHAGHHTRRVINYAKQMVKA